jgi:hypothetical protein
MTIARAVNSSRYDPPSINRLALRGTALAGAVLGLEPGALEAMFCRKCGYLELYVREPDSVEPDGETILGDDGW